MVDAFLKNQVEEEIPAEEVKPTTQKPSFKLKLESKGDKDVDKPMQFVAVESSGAEDKTLDFVEGDKQEDTVIKKKTTTITPKDLKLTKDELDLLKEIIWLVGSIPRTVKRYINIYRIIRAHQDLHIDTEVKKKEFLTLMFLLAINIGEYKEHAPKLLKDIKLKKNKRLEDYLVGHEDLIAIKDRLESNELIKELLQYEGTQFEKHIPFVGRFSFGNIEYSNNLADKELDAK